MLDAPENSAIQFHRSDAHQQIDLVRSMVTTALDEAPDVIVTVSAPVTLAAILATQDLPDPPAIFFADVYNLYDTGIAESDCIKPAHVTGVEAAMNYDEVIDMLLLQNPDYKTIGTIHDSGDAAGVYGAGQIAELGAARGLAVEQTAIVSLGDLNLAMEGLISRNAEAVLLPYDDTILAGLPIVANIANDYGIPVFSAAANSIWIGATVAAGPLHTYDHGQRIGIMVAAYLNGDLDPASTGISRQVYDSLAVMVNDLAAANLELDISPSLREQADATISLVGDQAVIRPSSERGMTQFQQLTQTPQTQLADREASDRAFLDSLACTPERIAEQQAELDAMDG